MADPRAVLSTILYLLWVPASALIAAVNFILSPFWVLARFISLPAIYLAHAIYSVLAFPFQLQLLERLETIYIWVGVAGLIGCVAGTVLFLLFKFLTSAFRIDGAPAAPPSPSGRTVKDSRATRRVHKDPHAGSPSGRRIDRVAALRRRGLSAQPILEEESEF